MEEKTRLKFKCTCTGSECHHGMAPHYTVTLQPVQYGSPENEEFWKLTPSGELTFTTNNEEAAALFVSGEEYYIDIFPAD